MDDYNFQKNQNTFENYPKPYIPPKGKALPLVIYEDGLFQVPKEAENLLTNQNLKNIGIMSLVGKYRTGKSFLLNKILLNNNDKNSLNGFNVGPTIKPCTKGIWIWSDPIIINNKNFNESFPCFIIDTEGLNAYDEEINQDTKIYLIAILISSLFIYNSFGPIDEPALETLSFIINLGKNIKLRNNEIDGNNINKENELIEYFPSLFWLLRDFSLKLEDKNGNTITSKQYLEIALENLKGNTEMIEQKNIIRNLIKNYFPERDCFTMVRPVENEKDLQNLSNLENRYFRKEFLEQSEIFRKKVLFKCRPKIFHKNTLTGAMLIELIHSILDEINRGCIPVIENSWKYIIRNECIKSSNFYVDKFNEEINNFRNQNKNDINFVNKVEEFTKKLKNEYVNNFLKNKLFDDESKREFQEKLNEKLNDEVDKFNRENLGIFRNNFQKNIDNEANKFLEDIQGVNKEKYVKSYYKFFQDLDEFKEKIEKSSPDFSGKNEIIYDKIMELNKKFFEINYIGNKEEVEEEIKNYKNEINLLNNKLNQSNEELFKLKQNNGDQLNKLNTDLISERMKNKNLEEKINVLLNEKKIIEDNYGKQMDKMKKDYEKQISDIVNLKNQNETNLHLKEKEIVVLKLNNEKITNLHEQKFKNFEKEIVNWKDKFNNLTKEKQNKEETLKEENEKLKSKIQNLKNEKKYLEKNNNDLINQDMKNLLKNFKDNIKTQSEENRNLINSILENQKENNKKTNIEIMKNLKESSEKNLELNNLLNKKENTISNLENEINNLNVYKSITENINQVRCKNCGELFNLEDFKEHYQNCTNENKSKLYKSINIDVNNNINFNPEKLKLKILKGKIEQDEIGKIYLNYIIDIKYNDQNWRLSKQFYQFATLYKSIKNLFQNVTEIPESGNIFLNVNNLTFNNFHENKIHQLEKFLNDLIEIEPINVSKPFLKFLEFDKNYDKDTETYLTTNQSIFNIQDNSYIYNIRKSNVKNEFNTSYENNYNNINDNDNNTHLNNQPNPFSVNKYKNDFQ